MSESVSVIEFIYTTEYCSPEVRMTSRAQVVMSWHRMLTPKATIHLGGGGRRVYRRQRNLESR